jgi:hypothetical protein
VASLDLDLYSLDDYIERLRQKQQSRASEEPIPHRNPTDKADKPEPRRAKESFFD